MGKENDSGVGGGDRHGSCSGMLVVCTGIDQIRTSYQEKQDAGFPLGKKKIRMGGREKPL